MPKSKLEEKVKELEKCLKEKDKRIWKLEQEHREFKIEQLKKEDVIKTFNFSMFVIFVFVIAGIIMSFKFMNLVDMSMFWDILGVVGLVSLSINAIFMYLILTEAKGDDEIAELFILINMVLLIFVHIFIPIVIFAAS